MDHWKRLLCDRESVTHDVGDDKPADDLSEKLFELGERVSIFFQWSSEIYTHHNRSYFDRAHRPLQA